jgi:riboflavin synthase
MFCGIVSAVGKIASIKKPLGDEKGAAMTVACPRGWLDAAVGDSIAVDGVCLTAEAADGDCFSVCISPHTQAGVAPFASGAAVNLESALRAGSPIGGHFVGGHIDGVGRVLSNRPDGECRLLRISAPERLRRYFAPKCSAAISGVSLTINDIGETTENGEFVFAAQLVPHTLAATTLGGLREGGAVNIETDMLARHLESLAAAWQNRG